MTDSNSVELFIGGAFRRGRKGEEFVLGGGGWAFGTGGISSSI